jgi:hypothetical protein
MKTRHIAEVVVKKQLKHPSTDVAFWRAQTYQARLTALEDIRQDYHRWKADVQPGLQRVYRIIKRKPG